MARDRVDSDSGVVVLDGIVWRKIGWDWTGLGGVGRGGVRVVE